MSDDTGQIGSRAAGTTDNMNENTRESTGESTERTEELLIEEISIDGMCGVY